MGESLRWFDDEDFWESMAPFLFSRFRTEEDTPAEVEQLLELTQPPLGARVLDLPCGPGRHAVALAARGFEVTGVDRTAGYLASARARAQAAEVEVEWVKKDMRRFRRDGSFDLALNLFTSFGYFERPEEDLDVLRNFHASLRPGGTLILSCPFLYPLLVKAPGRGGKVYPKLSGSKHGELIGALVQREP